MLRTYLNFILFSTLFLQVLLYADSSLESSAEFQKLLAEARKSNQAQDKKRDLRHKKEAEDARKAALLEIKKVVGETKFYNNRGEQIKRKDIDYISMPLPHINKGHLEFIIIYHNRDSGLVGWKDGSAKLDCRAYTNNGKQLGSIKNRKVHSSNQQIYLKLDTATSAGTLKCNLDFLGKTYNDTITFGGFRDLYSPTFSNQTKLLKPPSRP